MGQERDQDIDSRPGTPISNTHTRVSGLTTVAHVGQRRKDYASLQTQGESLAVCCYLAAAALTHVHHPDRLARS
jgi:hypothetical protein